jgi:hypothetical protein
MVSGSSTPAVWVAQEDGDWRAGYVQLTLEEGSPVVEIVRVPYEVERAIAGIHRSTLPAEFADYLQTGGKS